ncbi:hypothetical protein [Saccharopolyspora taberi]|uniref:Secreted protein n=1 Tax=Saccharopolyspora taberi TaxID=60895 RepID=A0ABN3V3V5_9PSEU
MDTKKIIGLAAIGLALYFVIADPVGSSNAVGAAGAWLQGVAQSFVAFLQNLFR